MNDLNMSLTNPGVAVTKAYVDAGDNALSSRVAELEKSNPRAYGVEFTKGQLDPVPARWIGDTGYQANNYIWDRLKVAKVYPDKTIKYLNQTNWLLMEDGTDSGIIIDGTTVTDDNADIMLVNPSPFYAILGGTHATLERRMICDTQFSYDGDTAVLIPANAVCVDFSVIKSGMQRSIRDNTLAGSGSAGLGGLSYLSDGKGCPTSGLSRFQYESYARSKNADTTKNTPYANNFQFDLSVWFTLLCIKFRTKDLHSASVLGGCISSNDSNPTVSTWGTQTGVRVTEVNGSQTFYNMGSTRFCALSTDSAQTFWNILNQYRPLLKMFEMQLALSYAKANSIAENTNFTYDGNTYNYVNIPNHKNISTGEMTAKVRKLITMSFTGWDKTNNAAVTNIVIDYCFEQAIVKGKIAGWGNMWKWISGIDAVCDNTGSLNNQYTFYQTSDISKITTDTDSADKNVGETFAFEKVYDSVGTQPNVGGNVSNYIRQMYDNSMIAKTLGSSAGLHTAECSYVYMGVTTAGKRSRRGVFFGGPAYGGACALRFYLASGSPTTTTANIAGGFRVAL